MSNLLQFFNGVSLVLAFTVIAPHATGQVDVEHRRLLTLQMSSSVSRGEEVPSAFGFYWFNEDHYPVTNTALRVIFAGVFVDAELSHYLHGNTNIAVGVGGGGGFFIDSVTPYQLGERLSTQQFYGDSANIRVFANHTISNPTPLPLNVRGTYAVSGSFYRETSNTANFILPSDFLTQSLLAELRFGGIQPGLTARLGAEVYLLLETSYRTGHDVFGPSGALFSEHSSYQKAFASISGKIPIQQTTIYLRVGGGIGEDLDELSSYKIGGNLVSVEPFATTLHGYYTREFFAEDFAVANLAISQSLSDTNQISLHLYGDWAAVKFVPRQADEWDNFFGVGCGVGFRTFADTDALVSYGYGINAVRNSDRGGHEIALALEKRF